ncbi:hypothetical protein UlMin_013805 [Ulmus minor]
MYTEGELERGNLLNNESGGFGVSSHGFPPENIGVPGTNPVRVGKTQDADYVNPQLIDEVEALILARVPRSEYPKFSLVNKRFLSLLRSGELFKIRKEIEITEPSVFMLAVGEQNWWAFDRQFRSRRVLPILPSDHVFASSDKETLCAGTHLLVSGIEYEAGSTVWRYDSVTNQWLRGPSMICSRSLFATATCGSYGYVAGGVVDSGLLVMEVYDRRRFLNSAERYNSETESWEPLPNMHRKRGSCSGCYLDNKFFVIGGRNEDGELTCAEVYDEERNSWELIPNMLEEAPVLTSQSPPLVAVANNELYSLEASTNMLKVYSKNTRTWRNLGPVPVRADRSRGWGVAFKSLGDELLVIGGTADVFANHAMTIYTCRPDPQAGMPNWRLIEGGNNRHSNFILNCSVMVA